MKKPAKQKGDDGRHRVREKAKPSNVVMESAKVHCDEYCKKSNEICGADVFEVVPI